MAPILIHAGIKTTPQHILKRGLQNSRFFLSCLPFDLYNLLRYGINAPKMYETIFINPLMVTRTTKSVFGSEGVSGKVMGGDWDLNTKPILELERMNLVKNKVLKDISWEEAGLFEKNLRDVGSEDKHSSFERLQQQYKSLDTLIESIKAGGSFLSTNELTGGFRNRRGINIHVGRDGEPIFAGGGGNHRLAIAQALELRWIPAKACLVHPQAVKNGAYRELTRRPAYPPAS